MDLKLYACIADKFQEENGCLISIGNFDYNLAHL